MTYKANVTLLSRDGKVWVVDKRHFVQSGEKFVEGIITESCVLIKLTKVATKKI